MKYSILALASLLLLIGCQKEVYHNITVTASPAYGGTVAPSSGPVLDGTSVSFKATPNAEYVFTGWSGSISGTENPKTVSVTQDMNVTANFALRSYPLTITVEGEGTVSEKVISVKSDYSSGTIVELTAKPSEHWLFDHWEGDITGNTNPAQITVSSSKSVKAVFVEKTYPLNVEIDGEGTVEEKIIQTKSTYQEGTIVELTAKPSQGWSFDHWEGELKGNDNPSQIVVSSEKNVKAAFVKNKYSFSVKIEGPGAVDEYLVGAESSLEYGSNVILRAFPSEGAIFKGWSGDYIGVESEVQIEIICNTSIVARFEKDTKRYPLIDLYQPSTIQKKLFYGIDFSSFSTHANGYYPIDYNRDGYVDIICTPTDWTVDCRFPLEFYIGNPDGSFSVDDKNNLKIAGLNNTRKVISGDYNGDNVPDICLIGHGYDAKPFPGEYPIVLLSNSDGTYSDIRFMEYVSFYHGGTSADFDNDGDLDIFLIDSGRGYSIFLINDGKGNFTVSKDLVNQELMASMYTAELFDIDKDGYIDLMVGGHDHEGPGKWWEGPRKYDNTPIVFWGNGKTFNHGNYSRLPITNVNGMGVAIDFIFYDINRDGKDEILLSRTGDGVINSEIGFYQGWDIQVIKCVNRTFSDATSDIIEGKSYDLNDSWICWANIESVDNEEFLIGRQQVNSEKFFQIRNGIMVKVQEPEFDNKYTNGFAYYADETGTRGSYLDLGCTDSPYTGSRCMHFNNWDTWVGIGYDYQTWMDFSYLEKNNYYLEFAIKNNDPDLVISFSFETRIQTDPWYFPTYAYKYWGNEHKSDGNWELIQVSLSSLKCGEEWSGYYWNTIKTLNIMPGECHGKDFYLDEIRIRRIVANK